ncbi:UNVERIFIED_CONTAM: hypothetical protein FKN15_061434 [Acipenser sinensis]
MQSRVAYRQARRHPDSLQGLLARGPTCNHLGATASEDHAVPGSLQAGPQAPGQSTGIAGTRNKMLTQCGLRLQHRFTFSVVSAESPSESMGRSKNDVLKR